MIISELFADRSSMRHQAAVRAPRQQIPRHAAEHPLAEPAVSVSAGDEQIGPFILRQPDQLGRRRSFLMKDHPQAAADAVPRQITGDVVDVFRLKG
jgi:hypothetical protein